MKKKEIWGWLFVSPYVLNLLILFVFPLAFSLYLTFTKYDAFNPPRWIGLKNWINVFHDKSYWLAFRNVVYFALIFVPLQTFLGIVTAYLLNKGVKALNFFRTIYFLPVITPWVAGGLIWCWIYNSEYGLLNWLLGLAGIGPINWVHSIHWWVVIGSIAFVNVWKGTGYSMVLFLAALQNIPKELLEACEIDGANKWKRFTRIVIPLISPTTFLVLILSTISAFQAFDVFLVMLTDGARSISDENNVINVLIYDNTFLFMKMGYSSAMAWILFIAVLAFNLLQKRLEKRWVHYE